MIDPMVTRIARRPSANLNRSRGPGTPSAHPPTPDDHTPRRTFEQPAANTWAPATLEPRQTGTRHPQGPPPSREVLSPSTTRRQLSRIARKPTTPMTTNWSPLLFPSLPRTALSDITLSALVNDQVITAVQHRSPLSFCESLAERPSDRREIVEAALPHLVQNNVRAAYPRSAASTASAGRSQTPWPTFTRLTIFTYDD